MGRGDREATGGGRRMTCGAGAVFGSRHRVRELRAEPAQNKPGVRSQRSESISCPDRQTPRARREPAGRQGGTRLSSKTVLTGHLPHEVPIDASLGSGNSRMADTNTHRRRPSPKPTPRRFLTREATALPFTRCVVATVVLVVGGIVFFRFAAERWGDLGMIVAACVIPATVVGSYLLGARFTDDSDDEEDLSWFLSPGLWIFAGYFIIRSFQHLLAAQSSRRRSRHNRERI